MENIGKYKIEKKIGSGGFGEVFKGYDPFIKRHVAVKTCSSQDEEIRNRFFQEAEIAGNLQHRNITTVYDFGIHNGLPYLIQEYLSGEDLDTKIKRHDFLPYPEKLYYLLQIARGLAQAHTKGVIHRDIKPANIRVLEDGMVKIMDFGIAKLAQQESGLTQTGMTLGTAAYLAPEQIRGEDVDHRTDIFSFGVLAYELLASERPFQGQQISSVIYQVLHHEPTPLINLAPNTPAGLVAIVERCLCKDSTERFANGSALVKELESLQRRDRPQPAHKKSARKESAPKEPPSPALDASEQQTETLHYDSPQRTTQRLDTPAPSEAITQHQRPTEAVATEAVATETVATATGPQLEDISYHTGQHDDSQRDSVGPHFAVQAKPSSRWSTVASAVTLLLLAAIAAGAGWWFGMRDESRAETGRDATALEDSATIDVSPTLTEEGADSQTPTGEGTTESSVSETSKPSEASSSETTADNTASSPEPLPAKPLPGRLILPIVDWTQGMTLRIANRTYQLRGRRSIELPPGSYQAVFELDAEDYNPAPRTVQVSIVEGKPKRLAIAIPQPGVLTIRPLPLRSQGEALIDGEPVGPTPLNKVKREPGEYTIEIRPQGDDGEGLTETVRLESGKEVILSFDLAAGEIQSHTKTLPR